MAESRYQVGVELSISFSLGWNFLSIAGTWGWTLKLSHISPIIWSHISSCQGGNGRNRNVPTKTRSHRHLEECLLCWRNSHSQANIRYIFVLNLYSTQNYVRHRKQAYIMFISYYIMIYNQTILQLLIAIKPQACDKYVPSSDYYGWGRLNCSIAHDIIRNVRQKK